MRVSNVKKEQKFDFLGETLRSIGDAVITTDLKGRITFLNPLAEQLTAWAKSDAIGKASEDIFFCIKEDSGQRIPCPVKTVLQTGTTTGYSNHSVLHGRDGTARPVSYNATPLQDASGTMQGVVLVFHCARAREALYRSEERLKLIERATNDAVWDLNVCTGELQWNEAALTVFGFSADELGRGLPAFLEKVHPDDRDAVSANLHDAMANRRYWQTEFRFATSDGNYSVVLERGYVLRDPLNNPVRMVGAMMDITGRRQAQEELLRINSDLERRIEERTNDLRVMNRELEAFSYSVSHDLRVPLRNILTLARFIQEESNLGGEAASDMERLIGSAQSMRDLIDDMLQYSRLTRTPLHVERVDLTAIARDVVHAIRERDEDSHTQFLIENEMICEGDPKLLRILYENLIENAYKFSSKVQSPTIEIGSLQQRGRSVFFVRDNGVGFSPSDAHKLFTPFERLHDDREFPGTGIGLANVQRIIQRHRGRTWAQGELNVGATFFFTLWD